MLFGRVLNNNSDLPRLHAVGGVTVESYVTNVRHADDVTVKAWITSSDKPINTMSGVSHWGMRLGSKGNIKRQSWVGAQ